MAGFAPTHEQATVVDLFTKGGPLVVQARAGTGKTSTLQLLAESTPRQGQYLAFNKAIVTDAERRFPRNVQCATAHSLAFRAEGRRYSHRLNGPRLKSLEVARRLGLDPLWLTLPHGRKQLSAGYLAGHVMRAVQIFCQTADPAPTRDHFAYIEGIDYPTADGRRTYANNRLVADHCTAALGKAWADIVDPDGQLRFEHGHYLKMWQLAGPRIPAEFILFDEAQDANPVMLAIVDAQDHAQRVYVGDDCQQIYSFTGAVNALARLRASGAAEATLSQSFRFGPEIAAVANDVLRRLAADPLVRGTDTIPSTVRHVEHPSAVLCRTNAAAVGGFLGMLANGRKPYLVGGGDEVARFARGVLHLQAEGWTTHPELQPFGSWGEVLDYVATDPQGSELKLLVGLIDEFGAQQILDGLSKMPRQRDAEIEISTAHKAKGREWAAVRLAGDFPDTDTDIGLLDPHSPDDGQVDDEELRLLYVAVTRARQVLDVTAVPHIDPNPDRPQAAVAELEAGVA